MIKTVCLLYLLFVFLFSLDWRFWLVIIEVCVIIHVLLWLYLDPTFYFTLIKFYQVLKMLHADPPHTPYPFVLLMLVLFVQKMCGHQQYICFKSSRVISFFFFSSNYNRYEERWRQVDHKEDVCGGILLPNILIWLPLLWLHSTFLLNLQWL